MNMTDYATVADDLRRAWLSPSLALDTAVYLQHSLYGIATLWCGTEFAQRLLQVSRDITLKGVPVWHYPTKQSVDHTTCRPDTY